MYVCFQGTVATLNGANGRNVPALWAAKWGDTGTVKYLSDTTLPSNHTAGYCENQRMWLAFLLLSYSIFVLYWIFIMSSYHGTWLHQYTYAIIFFYHRKSLTVSIIINHLPSSCHCQYIVYGLPPLIYHLPSQIFHLQWQYITYYDNISLTIDNISLTTRNISLTITNKLITIT